MSPGQARQSTKRRCTSGQAQKQSTVGGHAGSTATRVHLLWPRATKTISLQVICTGAAKPTKKSAPIAWSQPTRSTKVTKVTPSRAPLRSAPPPVSPNFPHLIALAFFPLATQHHTTGLHHHHTPATRLETCKSLRRGTISLDEPARPSFRTASSTSFGLPVLSPSLLPIHFDSHLQVLNNKSIAMREVISINGMGSPRPLLVYPSSPNAQRAKQRVFCSPLPTTYASPRPDSRSCTP